MSHHFICNHIQFHMLLFVLCSGYGLSKMRLVTPVEQEDHCWQLTLANAIARECLTHWHCAQLWPSHLRFSANARKCDIFLSFFKLTVFFGSQPNIGCKFACEERTHKGLDDLHKGEHGLHCGPFSYSREPKTAWHSKDATCQNWSQT